MILLAPATTIDAIVVAQAIAIRTIHAAQQIQIVAPVIIVVAVAIPA